MFVNNAIKPNEKIMRLLFKKSYQVCDNLFIKKVTENTKKLTKGENKKTEPSQNRKPIKSKSNVDIKKKNVDKTISQNNPKPLQLLQRSSTSKLNPSPKKSPKKLQKDTSQKNGTSKNLLPKTDQKTVIKNLQNITQSKKLQIITKSKILHNITQTKPNINQEKTTEELNDIKKVLSLLTEKIEKLESSIQNISNILENSKNEQILLDMCNALCNIRTNRKKLKLKKPDENFTGKLKNILLNHTKSFQSLVINKSDEDNSNSDHDKTDEQKNNLDNDKTREDSSTQVPVLMTHSQVMKQVFKNHSKLIEQIAKNSPDNFAEIVADISSAPPEIIEQALLTHLKMFTLRKPIQKIIELPRIQYIPQNNISNSDENIKQNNNGVSSLLKIDKSTNVQAYVEKTPPISNLSSCSSNEIKSTKSSTPENCLDIVALPSIINLSQTSISEPTKLLTKFDVYSMKSVELEESMNISLHSQESPGKNNALNDFYKPQTNSANNQFYSNCFAGLITHDRKNDYLETYESLIQNSLNKIEKNFLNIVGKGFVVNDERKSSLELLNLNEKFDTRSSFDILQNNFQP